MCFFTSNVDKMNLKMLFFGSDASCNLKIILSCRITVKSWRLQKQETEGSDSFLLCCSLKTLLKGFVFSELLIQSTKSHSLCLEWKKKCSQKNTQDKTKNNLVPQDGVSHRRGKQDWKRNNRQKFTSPLCNLLSVYVTAVVVDWIRDVHAHITRAGSVLSAGTRSVVSPTSDIQRPVFVSFSFDCLGRFSN